MNLVDLVIILLVLASLLRGHELGLIRQVFSTAGFFCGLALGVALQPHVINLAHTPGARVIVTAGVTFGCALILLAIGEFAGIAAKEHLQFNRWIDHIDNGFGAVVGGLSTIAMVWLSAVVLVSLPYPVLQTDVRGSAIVSILNHHLPPAPNIVSDVGHLIAPNGFPDVFVGNEPSSTPAVLPTPAALETAVAHDKASVVKIEGQGCGGIVEGSGFVVDHAFVATNAHVIAGIAKPYVIDENGTHAATPVWFDPDLDLAVLRVSDLAGSPLTFDTAMITHGTPGGVLGYPGGGPFTADTAAVLEEFTAVGRNIYNQGEATRDVYAVQANVVPGNSGGPLVDLNGNVMGIVFATSTTTNNTGYALSTPQVIREIRQAISADQAANTGRCAE